MRTIKMETFNKNSLTKILFNKIQLQIIKGTNINKTKQNFLTLLIYKNKYVVYILKQSIKIKATTNS